MYATYELASLRSISGSSRGDDDVLQPAPQESEEDFDCNTPANLLPVLASLLKIVFIIISPYTFIPFLCASYAYSSPWLFVAGLVFLASFLYHIVLVDYTRRLSAFKHLPIKAKPGMYVNAEDDDIKALLAKCPSLRNNAAEVIEGHLPNTIATPYIFGGDLRTLLPFAVNAPPDVLYQRSFVRVPLQDGPLDACKQRDECCSCDPACSTSCPHQFEAVAVDFAPKKREVKKENRPDTVFLILAGLTGGSKEGYVLDLVDFATNRGIDCYVMLGRGLSQSPNQSDATFHGARTSDVVAVASVVRSLLPPGTLLMLVGISMGGIIALNGTSRQVFEENVIDGAVSICGCANISINTYKQTTRVWQPILCHGLKKNIVAQKGALTKFKRRMGPQAGKIIAKTESVFDFDSKVIAPLHKFKDVWHYYDELSAVANVERFQVPILAVSAADDPILHADAVGLDLFKNSKNLAYILTRKGGHVGWPIGWFFWRNKWVLQNTLIIEWANALSETKVKGKDKEEKIKTRI